MAKSERLKTTLHFVRSTKNTHLFATDDPKSFTISVYVRKEAIGDDPPASITVSLTTEEK